MKKIRNKLLSVLACLGITAVFFLLGVKTAQDLESGEEPGEADV